MRRLIGIGPKYPILAAGVLTLTGATVLWAGTTVEWKGGGGDWQDTAMWGGTLPSRTGEARINGTHEKPSPVKLAGADVLVNHLSVGDGGNSLASLVLDGPSLTVSGAIDVGKYNGSDGRFVLKSGHLFLGTIFVSGGGGPGMRGRGNVEIEGGSLVTKDIELGVSAGCSSTVRVVGTKASGIVAEDGLHIGVYNYLHLGGVIETKGLVIREPYITIAGQTAPGDGICIKKTQSGGDALQLSGTHDVILRFLRVRAGNNTGQFRCDTFRVYDSDNFIVDHCRAVGATPKRCPLRARLTGTRCSGASIRKATISSGIPSPALWGETAARGITISSPTC